MNGNGAAVASWAGASAAVPKKPWRAGTCTRARGESGIAFHPTPGGPVGLGA
jgi:hypothetical protein